MTKLLALVRDTFRELLVRKVLLGFLALNVLALVGIGFFVQADAVTVFAAKIGVPVTDELRAQFAGVVEVGVAAFFDLLMILVSIFATASVIPTMMEKGTIDLYLSKPIARPMLLFGKVLGSVSVVAANIGAFMLAAWVLLSIKLGVWNPQFLGAAGMMLFAFVALYGIVVLLNVLTRSGTLGIIIVYAHALILAGVLAQREQVYQKTGSAVLKNIMTGLYYILPQTADHTAIGNRLIVHADLGSLTPIWTSVALAVVLYGAAAWVFSRKEF